MNKPIGLVPRNQPASSTHVHGRWSVLVRLFWGVMALPILGLFAASLPQYRAQLKMRCFDADDGWDCAVGQLTDEGVSVLQDYGLSLDVYAALLVILTALIALAWYAVAVLIVWRKSDDWMALLVALMLVATGTFICLGPVKLVSFPWDALASFTVVCATSLLLLVFTLFPDGRFVPRWTRWLLVSFVAIPAIALAAGDQDIGWRLYTLGLGLLLGGVVVAQIYRYRWVSTPTQRQQTKWVVLGVSVAIIVLAGNLAVSGIVTSSPGDALTRWAIWMSTAFVSLLIPASFGIAVLRYRLFDIDTLINRTLVYGTLSVLLAVIYFGSVLVLQTIFHGLTNQAPSIAIVISTLATAAVIQPLRRRVQRNIDRRFYRQKYDAARTLAAFSATLRNALDLANLRTELVDAVQQTMQPTHVSLWLFLPKRRTDHLQQAPEEEDHD